VRTRTLAELRDDVRLRADIVGATERFSDDELNEYVNQAWTKVYGRLAETGENYYLSESSTFSTVSGQDTYYTTANASAPAGTAVLPTDLWTLKGVDAQVNGPRWSTCQRWQFEQRNDYQDVDFAWPSVPMYDYQGTADIASVRLLPVPTAIYPFRVWYIPACPRLVTDQNTIDGGNGWERIAVDLAALWVAEKDDRFDLCERLDASMARWEQRLALEGSNRNLGQAPKMRRSMRYKRDVLRWPAGRQ
jgi:hypothetical protein